MNRPLAPIRNIYDQTPRYTAGFITICVPKCLPGSRTGDYRYINSKSEFFNGSIVVKLCDDCIKFIRVGIDYTGKYYTPSYMPNDKRYTFMITANLPSGTFHFDEDESNEDCVVVYFPMQNEQH